MDQQQTQPVQTEAPTKQNDFTKWIVLALFSLAIIGTGLAYILLGSSSSPASPQTQNTKTLNDLWAWQKYTNTEHGYSFVYYNIWTINEGKSDKVDFTLNHLSKTYPGTIEGSFSPSSGRTKSYCEQNRNDTDRCTIVQITANRELFMDRNDYAETGKTSLLIVHPTKGAVSINITRSNFDTQTQLGLITSTLTFTDEARIEKLQFCPDSWSTDRKTAVITNIEFDAKDIDNTKCNTSL